MRERTKTHRSESIANRLVSDDLVLNLVSASSDSTLSPSPLSLVPLARDDGAAEDAPVCLPDALPTLATSLRLSVLSKMSVLS